MLKMFTTQLSGLLTRLHSKEEAELENGARLLAQAAVGEGIIYIKGFNEMKGIAAEAIHGEEPLQSAQALLNAEELTIADRVLLVTRRSTDAEAIQLAQQLTDQFIPFVVISGAVKDSEHDLVSLADVHLNTQIIKGILPAEDGTRFGFPSSIAALYLYHGLKFTIDEMIEDYE
ncbi:DUF2529 domain-containing protein [Jeotgalibacillus soli]|uniref:DUF2529 domain-containing protein n=1 Tax=Jeotgalibacillus soli TaxID=889306 RepID=A0A0C2VLF1_9BACL|nr:DUF2529 domain-containing protein [Jeotgalibacillus soli]KIL49742.1 hypothetical protein KP78_12100 [Jeotgalibacillus soli]